MTESIVFTEAAAEVQEQYKRYFEAEAALDAALAACGSAAAEAQDQLDQEREKDSERISELMNALKDSPRIKLERLKQELEAEKDRRTQLVATVGAVYTDPHRKAAIEAQIRELESSPTIHDAQDVQEAELAALRSKVYRVHGELAFRLRQLDAAVDEAKRGVERARAALQPAAERFCRIAGKVGILFDTDGTRLFHDRMWRTKSGLDRFLNGR